MLTSSELVVTGTIWVLTAVGGTFSVRAFLRRRREQRVAATAQKESR